MRPLFRLLIVVVVAGCGASDRSVGSADGTAIIVASEERDGSAATVSVTAPSSPSLPSTTTWPGSASSSTGSSSTTQAQDAPRVAALGMVWTVIGVDLNDSLNVRDAPRADAQIIGTLARWSTGVAVTEDVESGDVGTWRRVGLPSGIQGWVNARSLVAQPRVLSPETRQQLVSLADTFVAAALDDGDAPDELLSPLALWVGGIGIYADGPTVWNWIPVTDLAEPTDWTRVRTFDQVGGDFDCGIDCDKSLNEFLRLARLDAQTQTLVNDIPNNARGLFDGLLWDAPESLHRVVFDKPNTADMTREGANWQRIHLVLDWSTGKPLIALINTHGWTP